MFETCVCSLGFVTVFAEWNLNCYNEVLNYFLCNPQLSGELSQEEINKTLLSVI